MMAPLAVGSSALILGCGYLGRRAAVRWLATGRQVFALTRSRAEELAALGITPIVGDLRRPEKLAFPEVDTILYAIGRDPRSGQSMSEVYVEGLANILPRLPKSSRLISISSTSVYGQTDGEYVTEDSPTEPGEESGRVICESEHLLRSQRPDAIILRFAGIYGPGRLLRKQALLNGEAIVGDGEKWLNLIHVEDGARAVLLAEERATPGETYLIADDTPVRRQDFYSELAQRLGAPPVRFVPPAPGEVTPQDSHRRVSNRKAREHLGFTPDYPSYLEGLQACSI